MTIDLLQWPAMGVTLIASWLIASRSDKKRALAFWVFIFSNILWIVWGLQDRAYALICLQLCLAAMNIRGAIKNDPDSRQNDPELSRSQSSRSSSIR